MKGNKRSVSPKPASNFNKNNSKVVNRTLSPVSPRRGKNVSVGPRKITNEDSTDKFRDNLRNGKSNVTVTIRVRPFDVSESNNTKLSAISIQNNKLVTLKYPGEVKKNDPEHFNKLKEYSYSFDYAFNERVSQEELYNINIKNLLNPLFNGKSATVFAFGPSGSGKTYTTLGNSNAAGMIPRAIKELCEMVSKKTTKDTEYKLSFSFLEIYNENIKDLLKDDNNPSRLDIKEEPILGSIVVGLSELSITNSTEAFKSLVQANKNRTREVNEKNESYSKSTAVLTLTVESFSKEMKLKSKVMNNYDRKIGKLIFVDLAGSERIQPTRLVEGEQINKSVSTFNQCIQIISDSFDRRISNQIPYKESKLTRLLKDSLLGQANLILISHLSPSIYSFEESITTLKFSSTFKNIKVLAFQKLPQTNIDQELNKYGDNINSLKQEIDLLKKQLSVKTHNLQLIKNQDPSPLVNKLEKIQKDIDVHFYEETKVLKEIIEDETYIDSLTLELSEAKYHVDQMESTKNKNFEKYKAAANKVVRTQTQIQTMNVKLQYKKDELSKIMEKREVIEKIIASTLNEPIGESLNLLYQYNVLLVNNQSLEQKKKANSNLIKIKEQQIVRLLEQLKFRDNAMDLAQNELKKNNIVFPLSSNSLMKIEELKISSPNQLPSINQTSYNSKTEIDDPSYRHFNYELHKNQKLEFYHKHHRAESMAEKNLEQASNYIGFNNPNSKIYKNGNNYNRKLSPNKKPIAHSGMNTVNTARASFTEDDTNNSIISRSRNKSLKDVDVEFNKKSKNLIKRNLVTRYKRSPYLKEGF